MSETIAKSRVGAVILAAGLGKRMHSAKLKVMHDLKNRPLIDYVMSAVEAVALQYKPVVVVCVDDPSVQHFLQERAGYAEQKERLGTGHAVSAAEKKVSGEIDSVVVLYGDMPFISPDSIRRLIARHNERDNTITMMTVVLPDFLDWRTGLYSYGRIIRGTDGHIVRITEKKDCTPEELNIVELNPGIYCFKTDWLWKNLKELKNTNAQGEYYLTDLIQLAIEQGEKISSISIEPREALGINSPEDLAMAENLV